MLVDETVMPLDEVVFEAIDVVFVATDVELPPTDVEGCGAPLVVNPEAWFDVECFGPAVEARDVSPPVAPPSSPPSPTPTASVPLQADTITRRSAHRASGRDFIVMASGSVSA